MTDRRLHDILSLRRTVAGVALAAGLTMALPAPPAAAQSAQTQELLNRIERLQQELNTLQSFVYRGQRPPAGAQPPAVASGGADGGNPAVVARLSVRISQLEGEIGRLTGQNEEFGHAIRQLQARLDKLVTDVDTRLTAVERRSGVAPAPESDVGSDGGAPGRPPPPAPPNAAAAAPPSGPGRGPQVLGQLRIDPATGQPLPGAPSGAPAARPAPPPQQQAARPETPEQMYDRAQALLLKEQNVGEAEKVLRAFLDAHPNHALAANAHYWLGRTYFVRQDYQQAAFTFADGFQKYPKSDKAAANLLNLGMSLARLGKTNEACTAYSRLLQNFPDAEPAVKNRAQSERQRAKCG